MKYILLTLKTVAEVLFTVWLAIFIVVVIAGYKVETFDPNDDIITILSNSKDKIEWSTYYENNEKTKRTSIRILIVPKQNTPDEY